MQRNGLLLVADMAAEHTRVRAALTYRDALVLGTLCEDVIALPFVGFSEYPSFRHFGGRGLPGGYFPPLWPGPRSYADACYRRALAHADQGALAGAFVSLGRILHIVTDACIPSHVHRVAHGYDPFEWHIEGNLPRLRAVPIPPVTLTRRPSTLVADLARAAPSRSHEHTGGARAPAHGPREEGERSRGARPGRRAPPARSRPRRGPLAHVRARHRALVTGCASSYPTGCYDRRW